MHSDPDYVTLLTNRVTMRTPSDPYAGLAALLDERESVDRAIAAAVRKRLPVGTLVFVPATGGTEAGTVDGYDDADPRVVLVRVAAPVERGWWVAVREVVRLNRWGART